MDNKKIIGAFVVFLCLQCIQCRSFDSGLEEAMKSVLMNELESLENLVHAESAEADQELYNDQRPSSESDEEREFFDEAFDRKDKRDSPAASLPTNIRQLMKCLQENQHSEEKCFEKVGLE
eukprot:GHVO01012397.1.p1 GENE.GHVO01012397.1~~GHVO01012397.1.p1  ORF type:complete len:121 (+),score=19.08 GHVO01012397.1:85-447(+)